MRIINIKRKIPRIFFAFFILGLIIEAAYSLPDGDDFSYFYKMKTCMDANAGIREALFNYVTGFYEHLTGDFVSLIILGVLSIPIISDIGLYSVFCVLFVIFFFCALFFFVKRFNCRLVNASAEESGFLIAAFILLGWLSASSPAENFYWLTCDAAYLFSISLSLIIVGIVISEKSENMRIEKASPILMCAMIFIAAGSSLQTATILLSSWLFFMLTNQFPRKSVSVAFVATVIATLLITVPAPGNFSRNYGTGVDDTLLNQFFLGVANSTVYLARVGLRVVKLPIFWIFIICIMGLRLFTDKLVQFDIAPQQIIKRVIASVGMLYAAVFPACFGYRLSRLSSRMENIVMLMVWILIAYWGIYLSEHIKMIDIDIATKHTVNNAVMFVIASLVVVCFFLSDNASIRAYKELISGKPQMQWENWNYIYDEVTQSGDNEVEVSIYNEYISGLMTRHDEAEHDGEMVISRSYMAFADKDKVTVNWITANNTYTLYGYRGQIIVDW